MEVQLKDLTRELVLSSKHIYADARDGTAMLIRGWRRLTPMVAAHTPGSLMPRDLIVSVPISAGDPATAVFAALEYLGFSCDESFFTSEKLH